MPVAIRIRVGCQSGHRGDAQNYHSPDLSTASRHAPQQRSCSAAAAISAAAWGEAAVHGRPAACRCSRPATRAASGRILRHGRLVALRWFSPAHGRLSTPYKYTAG